MKATKPRRLFSVRVQVPASSANLGPGFDALGLALGLYNEVDLSVWRGRPSFATPVEITGEGKSQLPLGSANLVFRTVRKVLAQTTFRRDVIHLRLSNHIPLARGLGSSSAAIVGGALAAMVGSGKRVSPEELAHFCVSQEGHPDNVVPALFGGLCLSVWSKGESVLFQSWRNPKTFRGVKAVVAVPGFTLETRRARRVLPKKVLHEDAVFNCSRTGLLVTALRERRWPWLSEAMTDRLHQPYRKKFIPGFDRILKAAKKSGAWGAALSGAGPSVVALCPPGKTQRVGRAMVGVWKKTKTPSRFYSLPVDLKGARVTRLWRASKT